ncbi:MAG: ABC transporter ATP-binding protein [Desulfovibrio sp.]|nr:ABC transporter ATP-binding protein [Desulfovibrio sp.]
MENILELRDVSKNFILASHFFGSKRLLKAVNQVAFSLKPGECLGLVGESGCGKSTLGRLAAGLLAPSQGCVLLHGKPLPLASAKSWAKGRIQMVFQDPFSALNPRISVGYAVGEGLRAQKKDRKTIHEEVETMLAMVGLPNVQNRYPHEFSGGQRQRIALAKALITKPDVVVCDEPVSALDASVQAQVLNLLCDLQEHFSPAYLFISHDLNVVGFICQRILVMYLGSVVEEAPTEILFNKSFHPYTKALLAARPGRPLQKENILPGEIPSPLAPPSGCPFHPRCPEATPICKKNAPKWHTMADNWRVRCHAAK